MCHRLLHFSQVDPQDLYEDMKGRARSLYHFNRYCSRDRTNERYFIEFNDQKFINKILRKIIQFVELVCQFLVCNEVIKNLD